MSTLLRFFATGPDRPLIADGAVVDTLYRRHRLRVMIAITLGYGLIYTCRLALGVVKKPLIDSGVFGPADLGLIGSALFYTYAIGKLTNGFLADHANMKRFLAALKGVRQHAILERRASARRRSHRRDRLSQVEPDGCIERCDFDGDHVGRTKCGALHLLVAIDDGLQRATDLNCVFVEPVVLRSSTA